MRAYIKITAILCLVCTAFIACADNEPASFKPESIAQGGDKLRSIKHLGSLQSCYDWTFTYSTDWIVEGKGTLRDSSPQNDASFTYTSKLRYQGNGVTMINSSGEKVSIQLNAMKYISTMQVNRNTYRFYYNADGRMSGWEQIIIQESLGQAQTYKSRADLIYRNSTLQKIEYHGSDNRLVTLLFTPSLMPNVNGLLPPTVEREMGCLGFEHLYYAGLLGRPSAYLIKSVEYRFEDESKNYTTDFEYGTHGINTVLCNYHTPDGLVSSISYGY